MAAKWEKSSCAPADEWITMELYWDLKKKEVMIYAENGWMRNDYSK